MIRVAPARARPALTRALCNAAALVVFGVAFGTNAADNSDLKSGVFNPPRLAPDFTLKGSNGHDLKLSTYRGKVVALGFGYTSCPDICPTTLAQLAEARKKLGAAGDNFQVVYVTVDPERDTVAQLSKYLSSFDSTFIGATGTPDQLAQVRKEYGIFANRVPPAPGSSMYFIHHSAFVYLIDREGRLRAMSPYGRSVDDVASDVKTLLTQ